ncbi:MAG: DUF4164 family protein [Rhodobiaceae bacterium]|nr:DUF4164 family protein [Bauldia sp.]MCC0057254.1 DUF4164 family protein [Rhodobiaceae bacterium]
MSDAANTPSPIETASRRLSRALDALESALAQRMANGSEAEKLRGDIQNLSGDRSRLAQELDQALAANSELIAARDEVETRIDRAMDAIRDVLGAESA